ncbi:MAG TPA: RNA methyltransferase [Candidatus Tectomicrobia bacterium]
MSLGYYGIGIIGCKSKLNIGTLWRSAYAFGASYIYTIAPRFERAIHRRQRSDTVDARRHLPYFVYETPELFFATRPYHVPIIAVELSPEAAPLETYIHPKQAVYLLGAEDKGIPEYVLERCNSIIQIHSSYCLNVATAGSIVMYDRQQKQGARGGEQAQWT